MKKTILLIILFCLAFFGKDAAAQIKLEDVLQKTQKITGGKTETMLKKNGLLPDSVVTFIYDIFTEDTTGPFSEVYSYNADGKVIDIISLELGAPVSRVINIYNGDHISESQAHLWNDSTHAWDISYKRFYYFDEDGVDTLMLGYTFKSPTDSSIRSGYRSSFSYDASGRVQTLETSDFPDWEPKYLFDFVYAGSDTVPNEYTLFYYDSTNLVNLRRETNLKWELGFDKELKSNYSVGLRQFWDSTEWFNYTYDSFVVADGKRQAYFSYYYSPVTNEVEYLATKANFVYDSKGSQIIYTELSYNGESYDTMQLTLDTFWYGSNDEILTHSRFERLYGQFDFSGSWETYYYGKTPVQVVAQRETIVFPNPVRSGESVQIMVKEGLTQVSAYDIKGQLVKTWIPDESGTVSTNGLMPGIYFLKATGGNGLYTGRLVVR